jgi:hypothetical protein
MTSNPYLTPYRKSLGAFAFALPMLNTLALASGSLPAVLLGGVLSLFVMVLIGVELYQMLKVVMK